jgi:two-component system chemotaxis response regulator CheB
VKALGAGVIGVVLTGMGDDGAVGARWVTDAGGVVLTESESSCVVYGMPRTVKEAGLSAGEASIDDMLRLIEKHL